MNGVTGDDLSLKTTPNANCGTGYDEWYEFWTYSSSSTSQSIACLHPMTMNWAEFILEAPPGYCGTSGTYSSGGNYYCQLPEFNESGSALGFTGNLCNNGGTCRGLDTNTDNVVGYYIYQGTQDTTTSAISGGTSWTETWDSSVN
jgi:hypothetical protein